MKTYFKHTKLTILFVFTVIAVFSQTDEKENNYYQLQNTMSNNVQQSTYNLSGFEGRAIQKLEEFAGYIEIISNKTYDIKLREHALTLAVKLFYDDQVKIKNSDRQLSSMSVMELNDYLNAILENGYAKIVVEISDQDYIENLKQSKSDSYSGKLIFEQSNTYYKSKANKEQTVEKKEVDIILEKSDKNFGKRTMSVWNVYLGEIRSVDK